jgi:glycosyltransferase involved in cell wall biosynthesis
MAAGLIPVTSDRNGSADIVKKIRADLVINTLDAEDYARKIKSINKSSEEKKYLSRRARLIAKEHSFKKGSERLNRVFNTFK